MLQIVNITLKPDFIFTFAAICVISNCVQGCAALDDKLPLYTNNLSPTDIFLLTHNYNQSLPNISFTNNISYSNVLQ